MLTNTFSYFAKDPQEKSLIFKKCSIKIVLPTENNGTVPTDH